MEPNIVNLGKQYYQFHEEFMKWCDNNVGKGGWGEFGRKPIPEDFEWVVGCMFGTCNYSFKTQEDMDRFKEVVAKAAI